MGAAPEATMAQERCADMAMKEAVAALGRSSAATYASSGIRVNVVAPSAVAGVTVQVGL